MVISCPFEICCYLLREPLFDHLMPHLQSLYRVQNRVFPSNNFIVYAPKIDPNEIIQ